MKKPPKQELARIQTPAAPVARRFGEREVTVDAVYHVKDIAPKTRGPWNGEAEKVAWTDPQLPWGYWLRMAATNQGTVFVDEEGRPWSSLRDAFWCSRLGMKAISPSFQSEVLETMLVLLVNKTRGAGTRAEHPTDIFDGNRLLQTIFDLWLQREALLLQDESDGPWSSRPSAEGHSVMLMLAATRPQPVRAMRPTSASVRTLIQIGIGPHSAEERMKEVERASAAWPAAFRRQTVGRTHCAVLEKRDVDAPVPVTRTVWTQRFNNEPARDVLYEWLCRRVDRWEDWARLAWSDSGSALTSHLLSLVVLSTPMSE